MRKHATRYRFLLLLLLWTGFLVNGQTSATTAQSKGVHPDSANGYVYIKRDRQADAAETKHQGSPESSSALPRNSQIRRFR